MLQNSEITGNSTVALGGALSLFDATLRRLREALSSDAVLSESVFAGSEEWTNLLSYKLVPHLAGDGCLIAAVTGGTNTGKSTVFNLLLRRAVSPMVATAAATARPVIAANASRAAQCLERKLVPEFEPYPLEDAQAVTERTTPPNALFVAVHETLPDRLVLLDTPDVDSIEREHWAVADIIRATGDVLIAVLTGEKYKDERVVAFFRQALASGRVVVPVMNKANPARDFEVARNQLVEFRELIGCEGPSFVLPHDFSLVDDVDHPIRALDSELTLLDYVQSLDVAEIKRRVYSGTVAHFAQRAEEFLERASDVALELRTAAREFEARAQHLSMQYDPAPGAAIGGMFHDFVQSKRGFPFRVMGAASRVFVNAVTTVGRSISGAMVRRANLENAPATTDETLNKVHGAAIERLTRDLATGYFESVRNLREPAAHMIDHGLQSLDIELAVRKTIEATIRSEDISEEFRQYAYRTLETWWQDNRGKRIALQTLDGILAITPAAIAGVMAAHTAGVGVDVALAVGGPMAEQFAARVIEYQFGDTLFDFLSPWRKEQRATLERALLDQVAGPCLSDINAYLAIFDGDIMAELRRLQAQCSIA